LGVRETMCQQTDKLHNGRFLYFVQYLYQIMFCDLTKEDISKACSMRSRDEKFLSLNLKSTRNRGISGNIAL
jgi:hypothetical protein